MFDHIPGTMQMSDFDCGPAAIRTVLAMFGAEDVSAARLAVLAGTDESGTSPDQVENTLRRYGFETFPINDAAGITTAVADRMPVIALVRFGDESHYVVVFGADCQGYLYVFDPVLAIRVFSPAEFRDLWHVPDGGSRARYAVAVGKVADTP